MPIPSPHPEEPVDHLISDFLRGRQLGTWFGVGWVVLEYLNTAAVLTEDPLRLPPDFCAPKGRIYL